MALDSQKIDRYSVYGLIALGFIVLLGGIFQLRSNVFYPQREIINPTQARLAAALNLEEGESLFQDTNEEDDLRALQEKDTDGDTLSDFQEQYVLGTSAYLADSDSDGLTDAEEANSGTNPNCAEGTACGQVRTGGTGTVPSAAQAFADINPEAAAAAEDVIPRTADGSVDVEALRQMLLDNGVPQDVLDQASDEDLVQMAQEAALESSRGANAFANVQNQAAAVKNMSIEEKRNLLIEAGIDASEVNKLSDEQIDVLVGQAVDDALAQVMQTETTTDQPGTGSEDTQDGD
jgi:hypothetical protein